MKKKKDIFQNFEKIITRIPVSQIMVKDIKTLNENDSAQQTIELMSKHSISGIIICNDKNIPTGMVSEGDLIKQVFRKGKDPKKVKLKDIMSKELYTIKPTLSIGQTSVLMKQKKISKLPVMDNGKIVGYVTKSDLLEELNKIYIQNRGLIWLTVMTTLQFIIIAILIIAYITK